MISRFSSQFEQFLEHATLVTKRDWENNHGILAIQKIKRCLILTSREIQKRKLYDFGFSLLLQTNERNNRNQEIKLTMY